MQTIHQAYIEMGQNVQELEQNTARGSKPYNGKGFNNSSEQQQTSILSQIMKLDFPRFFGDDPTSWVYQAKQYFSKSNS